MKNFVSVISHCNQSHASSGSYFGESAVVSENLENFSFMGYSKQETKLSFDCQEEEWIILIW